jgi:UDPglucose 6-dehydrogenase
VRISIIGSGIVGQATGMGFTARGDQVKFYDVDRSKLLTLHSKGYQATDNLENAIEDSEILFVCVPTPTIAKRVDLSCIKECTEELAKAIKKNNKYKVVTYRSTIPPQTTRTELIPLLEGNSDLKAGQDFGVCMNPEFLREKTPLEDFLNPNRIVVGALDNKSASFMRLLYSPFKCPLIITDLDTAEMIKYTSNTFLAAKISFFNEIFMVCQELKIDPKTVSAAVGLDPRIGDYGIDGGRPFAGMCLPKDLYAFIQFSKSIGINPTIHQAVARVNEEMCQYCATNQETNKKTEQPLITVN